MLADGWCHHCFPSLALWWLSFHSVREYVCLSVCLHVSEWFPIAVWLCLCVYVCVSSPVWLCCTLLELKKPKEAIVTAISNMSLYFYYLCMLLWLQGILVSFFSPFKPVSWCCREISPQGSINVRLILHVFNYFPSHEAQAHPGRPLQSAASSPSSHLQMTIAELIFISVQCKIAACPASTMNEWIINKFTSAIYFLWWVFWLN